MDRADLGYRRILVVDDNIDLAELMSRLLGLYGYEVETASSGRSAIEMARAFDPQVVLLDIGLPDMSGYQVADALRHGIVPADTTLIAMSAYDPGYPPGRKGESDFDHYFVKPVDIEALLPFLTP